MKFRRTTPGSVNALINPGCTRPHQYGGPVNPHHPASKLRTATLLPQLPSCRTSSISVKAFPKAMLAKPTATWQSPPWRPAPSSWPNDRRVNMSICIMTGIKAFGNRQVIRKTLVSKIKNALNLIVVRDPTVTRNKIGEDEVTFSDKPNPGLIMSGSSGSSLSLCPLTWSHP